MNLYNYIRIRGGDNMKGTIPREVTAMIQLPECWIWKNRHYIYTNPKNSLQEEACLPTVRKEYESVLKELGIPYRVTLNEFEKEVYEYWNPSTFEEKAIKLPVYTKMGEKYRHVSYHTEKKATSFTVEEAKKLMGTVEEAIAQLEEKWKKEEFFRGVKAHLGEKQAVAFYDESYDESMEMDYVCGEDRIRAIPVVILQRRGGVRNTNWYACFNVNQIELNSVVTLEKVPKGKAGMFAGTGAWQVKEWCQKLGLKFIKIVEPEAK